MTEQPAIAIVGMAFRLPAADDPDEFWRALTEGRQLTRRLPPQRLTGYSPELVGTGGLTAAIMRDVGAFDAEFFGINPRMATWMDPQQRLLLETSWHAMESAGIPPSRLRGTDVGVYVSSASNDFRERMFARGALDRYSLVGTLPAYLANRLSHQYDLHGPSYMIDTACSGGLSAIVMAVSALRAGEVDVALVGGANLCLAGFMQATVAYAGALSPTGVCRPFSEEADGYVRGEGVLSFVFKRLDDALADGDPIVAVIRGAVANHDGRAGGLVKPDAESQRRLALRALAQCGLSMSEIGYVEAHAPGTKADSIELAGLLAALGEVPPALRGRLGPDHRVWVNTVKKIVGHLEGGAGGVGVAAAALVLEREAIPTAAGVLSVDQDLSVHRHDPTKPGSTVAWPRGEVPRRVGISSFGIGGSNGYVVLEEAPATVRGGEWGAGPLLVPVSAADEVTLREVAGRLAGALGPDGPDLASVAWTLQTGREHLAVRAMLAVRSREELRAGLERLAGGATPSPGGVDEQTNATRERWERGETLDWARLWRRAPRARVRLPGYPFRRTQFGFEPELARQRAAGEPV